jgi:hypothetical protein
VSDEQDLQGVGRRDRRQCIDQEHVLQKSGASDRSGCTPDAAVREFAETLVPHLAMILEQLSLLSDDEDAPPAARLRAAVNRKRAARMMGGDLARAVPGVTTVQ